LNLFFNDLKLYKNSVGDKLSSETPVVNVKMGWYTHQEHIQTRLKFLEFILSNSSLLLSVEQVDTLWDCLVVKAVNVEEREMLFVWLENTRVNNKDGFLAFSENVIDHLFMEKMSMMDCSTLSVSGYKVFERYFLYINEKNNKLKRIEKKNESPEFYVISPDMFGMNNMWIIALDALQNEVGLSAIKRLSSLYQYFSPESLKPKLGKLREDYISTAMKYLSTSVSLMSTDDGNSKNNEQRIERCLILLKSFIEEFEDRGRKKVQSQTKEVAPQSKALTLFVKADKGTSYVIQMLSSDSVKALRYKIAEQYGEHIKQLRIFLSDNRELKDDSKSLQDIRIVDRQQLFVKKKTPEVKKSSEQKKSSDKDDKEDEEVYEDIPAEALLLEAIQMTLGALGLQAVFPFKRPVIPVTPDEQNKKPQLSSSKAVWLYLECYVDILYLVQRGTKGLSQQNIEQQGPL
jgi:hypothetical protein